MAGLHFYDPAHLGQHTDPETGQANFNQENHYLNGLKTIGLIILGLAFPPLGLYLIYRLATRVEEVARENIQSSQTPMQFAAQALNSLVNEEVDRRALKLKEFLLPFFGRDDILCDQIISDAKGRPLNFLNRINVSNVVQRNRNEEPLIFQLTTHLEEIFHFLDNSTTCQHALKKTFLAEYLQENGINRDDLERALGFSCCQTIIENETIAPLLDGQATPELAPIRLNDTSVIGDLKDAYKAVFKKLSEEKLTNILEGAGKSSKEIDGVITDENIQNLLSSIDTYKSLSDDPNDLPMNIVTAINIALEKHFIAVDAPCRIRECLDLSLQRTGQVDFCEEVIDYFTPVIIERLQAKVRVSQAIENCFLQKVNIVVKELTTSDISAYINSLIANRNMEQNKKHQMREQASERARIRASSSFSSSEQTWGSPRKILPTSTSTDSISDNTAPLGYRSNSFSGESTASIGQRSNSFSSDGTASLTGSRASSPENDTKIINSELLTTLFKEKSRHPNKLEQFIATKTTQQLIKNADAIFSDKTLESYAPHVERFDLYQDNVAYIASLPTATLMTPERLSAFINSADIQQILNDATTVFTAEKENEFFDLMFNYELTQA